MSKGSSVNPGSGYFLFIRIEGLRRRLDLNWVWRLLDELGLGLRLKQNPRKAVSHPVTCSLNTFLLIVGAIESTLRGFTFLL